MRYTQLKNLQKNGQKEIAILIDPDELGERTPTIISTALQNNIIWINGADIAVVGNAVFEDPKLIEELIQMRQYYQEKIIL